MQMIDMTRDKIDNSTLVPTQMDPLSGATVLFLGTAREITGDRQTESLEYDAYVEMATNVSSNLPDEARGSGRSTPAHRAPTGTR